MKYRSFAEFLENKFLEYRQIHGQNATEQKFAAFLGFSQSTISKWLSGNYLPSRKTVKILSQPEKLGPEIYEIILKEDDPNFSFLNDNWDRLDDAGRKYIRECAERYLSGDRN